jgi:hypothetical protein
MVRKEIITRSSFNSTVSSSLNLSPIPTSFTPFTSTTNAASNVNSSRKTKYNIHHFLMNNESRILSFGQSDRYIVNNTDMVAEFKKFKKNSIEYIKEVDYLNQDHDVHRMLYCIDKYYS